VLVWVGLHVGLQERNTIEEEAGMTTIHGFSRRNFCLSLTALATADRMPVAYGQAPTKVRFGVSPFQDTLIPLLGQNKGWYKEEGLEVEFRILGWTEVQEALSSAASDRVDIAINNETAVVATNHRNRELVYVYGFNIFDAGFALMGRPNGPARPIDAFLRQGTDSREAIRRTAAQLRGLSVITTANTDMEQGVAAAAARGGLDFTRDIRIINLNPDEGLAAFLAGEGDLFIGGLPQRFRAKREGMIEILTGLDLGPVPINGVVSTKPFVEKNQQTIFKVLKVWFRSVQYINNNIDSGASIIIDILNRNSAARFTVDDFKAMWNKLESFPPTPAAVAQDILNPSGRSYWKNRWDDCNTYLYHVKGVIPRPVDPAGVFLMPEIHLGLERFLKG
jgi:NitT/TauT family transport system substrate-binding protein